MEICFRDNLGLENLLDLEDIFGKMAHIMKETLSKDTNKVLENGGNLKIQTLLIIKVNF